MFIRAVICKMLFRIANREDPDQTDLGLSCLSRPFGLTTSDQNFLTSTELFKAYWKVWTDPCAINLSKKNTIYRCSKISNTSCLPKWLDKQRRPRSSVIRAFPVCYYDKHFVKSSPEAK